MDSLPKPSACWPPSLTGPRQGSSPYSVTYILLGEQSDGIISLSELGFVLNSIYPLVLLPKKLSRLDQTWLEIAFDASKA